MPDNNQPGVATDRPIPEGMKQYNDLQAAGLPADQLNAWKQSQTQDLMTAGANPNDVAAYWGDTEPTPATAPSIARPFNANLQANAPTRYSTGLLDNLSAGWNMSVGGLMQQGKAPDENVEPRGLFPLLSYALGKEAGDLVPGIAGFFGGATAGAAVPGAGETGVSELIGGGAGTAAVPEAMRQALIAGYRRGEIHSFSEAMQVAGHATVETGKQAIAGGLGNLAGGGVGRVVEQAGANALVKTGAGAVVNNAVTTASLGALNGRIPDAQDFIAGTVIALGVAGAGSMAGGRFEPTPAGARVQHNLEDIYVKTGVPPWEAAQKAQTDPRWRQAIYGQDIHGDTKPPLTIRQLPDPPPFGDIDPTKLRNVTPGIDGREPPMNQRAPIPVTGNIDHFMQSMAGVEGSFLHGGDTAVSPAGATGRYQIMPGTARQYGFDPAKLSDPEYNTRVAHVIAQDLYRRYNGDEELMLAAYNAGPGRANELRNSGPGTRLVATPDKTARGGVRYTQEASARDESHLPNETQKYLANARRRAGGELPGSRGGFSSGQLRLAAPTPPTQPQPELVPFEGATPARGAFPTGRGQNDLTDLSAHSPRMWREVSPDLLESYLPTGKSTGRENASVHLADTPDLALGQGDNRGVTMEFDSKGLTGRVDFTKPSSRFGYEGGTGSEYKAEFKQPAFQKSLRAVRIAPDAQVSERTQLALDKMTQQGWRKTTDEHGTTYTRPAAARGPVPAAGVGGGAGAPPEGPGGVQLPDWAQPQELAEGGGAGGGEPPEPPPPGGPNWDGMSTEDLYAAIHDSIGEENRAESLTSPTRLLSQFVSELEPARKLDQALIKDAPEYSRTKDMLAEDMFRQTYASDKRAGVFIRYGAVDPISLSIIKGTPSMLDAARAVKEDGGDVGSWEAWMVAKRAVDKANQGVTTGVETGAAEALGRRASEIAKYERGTKLFNDVGQSVLRYGEGSGFFSAEQVAAMIKDNETHISFRRVLGDDKTYSGNLGRSFKVKSGIKVMEGSDRLIDRPIFSSMDNWRIIVKLADRNRAIGHIIGQATKGYLQDLGFEKLEYDPKATLAPKAGDPFEPYGPDGIIDRTTAYASILAERSNGKLGANQFMYFNKGKPELWQTKDPDLARLLRGADSQGEADIISKVLQTFASIERAGIVGTPHFAVVNILKDQIGSFVFDPRHPMPFVTLLKGVTHAFSTDDVFQDWVAKGGAGAALVDMDLKYLERDMHSIFEETGANHALINVVQHPLEFAQIIGERLDAASRIGYFKDAKAAGVDPVKAATMSRKMSLDFSEKATLGWVNTWSKWVPFFRPSMLSLKQLGEALYDPAAKNPAALPSTTIMYAALGIVIPSIILHMLNTQQDKDLPEAERYANLPQWERDMYYISPQIGGAGGFRFKLGMPQSTGIAIGGFTNRFMDHLLTNNPVRYNEWAASALKQLAPPMIPTVIAPVAEHVTNHDFFTGAPLIPSSLEAASGYMQYTENTTETAKALSRFLAPRSGIGLADVSPIVIENYVREWAGTLGQQALKTLDAPYNAEKKPWELSDIPFVQGFVTRNPGMSAEPIQRFYEDAKLVDQATRDMSLAKNRMAIRDNDKEMDLAISNPLAVVKVRNFQQALSMQAEVLRGINADKTMNRDEKRQMADQLYSDMITEARIGSDIIRSIRDDASAGTSQGQAAPVPAPVATPAPQAAPEPAPVSPGPIPKGNLNAPPQAAPGSPNLGPPLTVGGR